MIAFLQTLKPAHQKLVAWLVVALMTGVLTVPILVSAGLLVQSRAELATLQHSVDQLSSRVEEQALSVSNWYQDHGQDPEDIVAYSDPELARIQFENDVDQFGLALIDAGASLTRLPSIALVSHEGGVVELNSEVEFSGLMGEVMTALLAPEFSRLRVGGFVIDTLPDPQGGRVRGRVQLQQFYIMEGDENG